MQEQLFPDTITRRLYNERSILIGTFLGGPLAGGFLLAQNFKALDQPVKARITWAATIATLLLLIGTAFIPFFDQIPSMVYSFAFCFAAHSFAKHFQGRQIVLHQEGGGQLYSTWRAAGFGLVSLVLMLGWILLLLYLGEQ